MYKLYEGTIGRTSPFIDTTFKGDAKIKSDGTIVLPSDCIYINLINMSPFKLSISMSGGALDEYIEPNAKKDNIYIGKQGGSGLTIAGNLQTTATAKVIAVGIPSGVTQTIGDLTILGKKVDENWQGVLPLTAGAVAPILGGTLASVTIAGINNWLIAQDAAGNLYFQNTNTGAIYYMHHAQITSAFFFGGVISGPGGTQLTQALIDFVVANGTLLISTPLSAGIGATGIQFDTFDGVSQTLTPFTIGNAAIPGNVIVDNNGHILTNKGTFATPTLGALQAGISAQTISGNDVCGLISVTTTASPPVSGNHLCLVTFTNPYPNTPMVIINTGLGQFFPAFGSSTTGFGIYTGSNLAGNTQYFFNYFIVSFQ